MYIPQLCFWISENYKRFTVQNYNRSAYMSLFYGTVRPREKAYHRMSSISNSYVTANSTRLSSHTWILNCRSNREIKYQQNKQTNKQIIRAENWSCFPPTHVNKLFVHNRHWGQMNQRPKWYKESAKQNPGFCQSFP